MINPLEDTSRWTISSHRPEPDCPCSRCRPMSEVLQSVLADANLSIAVRRDGSNESGPHAEA